jgi:hypothetical protein
MMTLPKLDEPVMVPEKTGTNSKIKCSHYEVFAFTDDNFSFTLWAQDGIILLAPACWLEWQGKSVDFIHELLAKAGFRCTIAPRTC